MKAKSFSTIFIILLTFSFVCAQKKSISAKIKQPIVPKLFGVDLIKNGSAETDSGADWTNADELKTFNLSFVLTKKGDN